MTTVEFGSLFRFIRNGMNVKQDKSGNGLPITRIESISDSVVDPARVGYAGLTEHQARDWLLEPGDILFSHINSVPHIGKCAVYRGQPAKLVHGMNLLCLRSDKTKLSPEFAKYLLRSWQFRSRLSHSIKKAVNQASVSIRDLQAIEVTVPALPEQRRIADILDKADALKIKRREAIAQLETLVESIFLDVFGNPETNPKGWPTRRLDTLVRDGDTINYGVVQPGDDFEDGIPLVRVGDMVEGHVNHAALKRIDPAIEANYTRSRLRGDEILVSCVGSIGAVALTDESVKGFNIARAVARIPLDSKTSRVFVAEYLKTNLVQRYFKNELRTVSQPTLNIKQISETPVFLPPLNVQREIERRIVMARSLEIVHRSASGAADALFASLQERAFRGTL